MYIIYEIVTKCEKDYRKDAEFREVLVVILMFILGYYLGKGICGLFI